MSIALKKVELHNMVENNMKSSTSATRNGSPKKRRPYLKSHWKARYENKTDLAFALMGKKWQQFKSVLEKY